MNNTESNPINAFLKSNITINCESQEVPQWTFSEGHLLENTHLVHDKVYITNVNSKNGGVYECESVNFAGESFIKQFEVHVICKLCLLIKTAKFLYAQCNLVCTCKYHAQRNVFLSMLIFSSRLVPCSISGFYHLYNLHC